MGSEHSLRWKSALVMLAVIGVVGFIDNRFLTWLFFTVVLLFASKEASELFKVDFEIVKFLVAGVWVLSYFVSPAINLLFIALILFASILAYSAYSNSSIDRRAFLPLLYPLASILFIWSLYVEYHMSSLVALLVIVALSDVGAYYVGRAIGKRPFSPTSPNKTLEGVFGGITLGGLVGSIVIYKAMGIDNYLLALVIAIFVSIFSIFGDLFESYLKREAGVKDSGDLIPGHGGILDRIDGYMFAGVIFYIILKMADNGFTI